MTTSVLKMQHTSLEFKDLRWQQEHDVHQIFAKGKQFPIKTGTESGAEEGNSNREFLKKFAKEYNHRIHFGTENWVAVDRAIIKPGSAKKKRVFVAHHSELKVATGHDREFPALSFTHVDPRIGRVAVAAAHYATHGRVPGDPNYQINHEYADKLSEWMRNATILGALAFVAGDFNMVDKIEKQDWAFGNSWTSMADELKAWQNTGHGPIDGFASLDRQHRVKAKKFVVLDDKELKLFADHYMCRGTWTVKHLKVA